MILAVPAGSSGRLVGMRRHRGTACSSGLPAISTNGGGSLPSLVLGPHQGIGPAAFQQPGLLRRAEEVRHGDDHDPGPGAGQIDQAQGRPLSSCRARRRMPACCKRSARRWICCHRVR